MTPGSNVQLISQLLKLTGSSVEVTLHIEAAVPSGISTDILRAVSEDSRTLNIHFDFDET